MADIVTDDPEYHQELIDLVARDVEVVMGDKTLWMAIVGPSTVVYTNAADGDTMALVMAGAALRLAERDQRFADRWMSLTGMKMRPKTHG